MNLWLENGTCIHIKNGRILRVSWHSKVHEYIMNFSISRILKHLTRPSQILCHRKSLLTAKEFWIEDKINFFNDEDIVKLSIFPFGKFTEISRIVKRPKRSSAKLALERDFYHREITDKINFLKDLNDFWLN